MQIFAYTAFLGGRQDTQITNYTCQNIVLVERFSYYRVCKADKGLVKLDQRLWMSNQRAAGHAGYWVGGLRGW